MLYQFGSCNFKSIFCKDVKRDSTVKCIYSTCCTGLDHATLRVHFVKTFKGTVQLNAYTVHVVPVSYTHLTLPTNREV